MHDNLGKHACQKEFEEAYGEPEACPVMPILHHVQSIAFEVYLTVEIHLMERLHGDLVSAMVLPAILFIVKLQVALDRLAWEASLFVLPRSNARCNGPKGDQYRDGGDQSKEYGGVQATANFASKISGNKEEQSE